MIWVVIVIVVVVVLLLLWLVAMYNRLVRLRNRAENAWAQVDVQLRKRYDLIPNLVETVKGYAAHERETFEAVTAGARRRAAGAGRRSSRRRRRTCSPPPSAGCSRSPRRTRSCARPRTSSSSRRSSPTSSQNIAVARQVYNDTVLSYENALETVPTSIIAGMFNFRPREYFQTEDATREAPRVDFGQGGGTVAAAPPPAAPPAAEPPRS